MNNNNNNNINIIENMLHGGHIAAQIGRAFWCPYARLDAEEKGGGKHGKVWSDDFDSCMHVCPLIPSLSLPPFFPMHALSLFLSILLSLLLLLCHLLYWLCRLYTLFRV